MVPPGVQSVSAARQARARAAQNGDPHQSSVPRPSHVDPPALAGQSAATARSTAAPGAARGMTATPSATLAPAPAPPVPVPVPVPAPDADATQIARVEQRPTRHQVPRTATKRAPRVRKARLRLLRVDPWSVMKTSFLLAVALGVALFVAVAVLWSMLDALGVFETIDELITTMTASQTSTGIDINQYVELSRVLGFTTLVSVINVVLITALCTLGAFLYNLSASLLGGLELTLAEDD